MKFRSLSKRLSKRSLLDNSNHSVSSDASCCIGAKSLMKGTMQSTSSTITLTLDEGDEDEQLMTDDDTPAIPVPKTVIMPKSVVSKEVHLLDPSVEQQGAKDVLAALTPDERDAIPDPNMPLRHFRAEKGNLPRAIVKIKETLAWRKEFEVEKIIHCFDKDGDEEMRKIILEENETGKMYSRGTDNNGRASVYMRPHFENTNNALNNMRHLVYQLERAAAVTEAASASKFNGQGHLEKMNLMIDFGGFKIRDSPPMATTKWTIDILQNHYPERLHRAYILNPGLVFRVFIPMVRPFLDPVTKDKVCLCNGTSITKTNVGRDYDLSTVEVAAGGKPGSVKEFNSQKWLLETPFHEPY